MTQPEGIPQRASFFTALIQSIFPGKGLSESRDPFRPWFNSLLLHFRPRKVLAGTLKFTLTWGLGGTAVVLIALLLATGLLLKFAYRPSPEHAYASVQMIQYEMRFGGLIRNVHHWSGHLLVLVAFLHFLRVFFSGAFHTPRQFNWIIGLGLLGTVLLANFSGYLLPWDQLSYWAITICTGMLEYIPGVGTRLQQFVRGGAEVGPETLANFFAIHTALLPALLILLLPFHFWRIRKAKGLVVPRAMDAPAQDQGPLVPAIPNLLLREVVVALVVVALVLMVALVFDAPLAEKANPGLSPNPTKAPWYFAGFQELLLHFHPLVSLFIMPLAVILALLAIPYLPYPKDSAGIWFASAIGRKTAGIAGVCAALITPAAVAASAWITTQETPPGGAPWIFSGLTTTLVLLAILFGFSCFIRRRWGAQRNEVVQGVFVFLLTAFIVLTVIGVWFRGPGMVLTWPWN